MTDTIKRMTDVWGVIRSTILDFAFSDIKKIVGFAGLDMALIAGFEQAPKGGATKSQLLSEIDLITSKMDTSKFNSFVSICCEKAIEIKPTQLASLNSDLKKLGWNYVGNNIIPIGIINIEDLSHLPQDALTDINKAMARFRENDLSGTITSLCAALDTTTSNIYKKHGLGNPDNTSFQERILESIKVLGVQENLEKELADLSWNKTDISSFTTNVKKSFTFASLVMQTLRSKMGDVHGTKPVIEDLVYDSIKWSTLLLRMLS